jgi:hypothetical protein
VGWASDQAGGHANSRTATIGNSRRDVIFVGPH